MYCSKVQPHFGKHLGHEKNVNACHQMPFWGSKYDSIHFAEPAGEITAFPSSRIAGFKGHSFAVCGSVSEGERDEKEKKGREREDRGRKENVEAERKGKEQQNCEEGKKRREWDRKAALLKFLNPLLYLIP